MRKVTQELIDLTTRTTAAFFCRISYYARDQCSVLSADQRVLRGEEEIRSRRDVHEHVLSEVCA